jgi:hypothetical protein
MTMQLLYCLVFTISVLAITSVSQVYAQKQNQTVFTSYENPEVGFSIQHPVEWPVVNVTQTSVMFSPVDAAFPSFSVKTRQLTPYLDTATMTVKNATLDMFVQEFRTNISKPNSAGMEMKLIRQNDIIVGGNPAVKFETTMSIGPQSETRVFGYLFYILTIANGKLYSLEYDEKPLKVPETLPIANEMVYSFRFIP